MASAYAGLGFEAELAPFFDDLPERMTASHLIVSRAGASSVAELLALGRPALLVPYRFAAEGHQSANAEAVSRAGACWLIEETKLDAEALAARLRSALDQPQELVGLAGRAAALGRTDAASALADAVQSLDVAGGGQDADGGSGMRTLPFDAGGIHFVGIGGIGMSGIAEVLHNLGHRVQGSDVAENANTERLRRLGIPVAIGHRAANLGECGVVVMSSAIKADNPEIEAARGARVPVVRRAEMLGELMRLKWAIAVAGTHGKTTTTSLIAALLDAAKLDPTVINGGIINAYGTNARHGKGDWMVVEADESDGTFVRLPASAVVVTNIDPEHMEFYGQFDAVRAAFQTFVENIPFYGFATLCIDHPEVQALFGRITDRRLISYGFSPQADVRALDPSFDLRGAEFDVELRDRMSGLVSHRIERLRLSMLGRHNVQNALAAIAVARELAISDDVLRRALANFGGVKRRFTRTGTAGGITVIDDYGHHPVEIRAVLATARQACGGRVIAVVQPHRYTRLAALFEEFCTAFNDADCVLVAPVYAAGEAPIAGVDRDALVEGVRRHGHRDVRPLDGPEQLPDLVAEIARSGDLVVCLGAGNITAWANALPAQLRAILGENAA